MKNFLLLVLLLASIYLVYYLIKKNKKIKSILFIGDSNTAFYYSYADQLKNEYPNLVIKKIALSGAKTDWMKNQLINELNINKYDAVSILGGSNDIYALNSIDSAKQNLNDMYSFAKSKGSIVIAITPPSKNFYVNRTEQKQVLLNSLVSWMKRNIKIDYLIDFNSISNDKSFFSQNDGYLHANSQAHKLLENQLKSKIVLT